MLVDKAADAIRDVEMEKSKIKTLREEADSLEDAIYRLSSEFFFYPINNFKDFIDSCT